MAELSIEGRARKDILNAALSAGKAGAHIAPSLSLVEIVLGILSCFDKELDTFILSKGHGALGYYAAMHQLGYITDEQFSSFEENGGEFPGQPCRTETNHIDYSGGSLGMGLTYGVGTAIAKPDGVTFVVMGDGEVNEGSVWEAASYASKMKLSNLVVIIDQNGFQSDGRCVDIMNLNLEKLWEAFGWNVCKCEGHSKEVVKEIISNKQGQLPLVILAQTIKGKGVSFMENNNAWHHCELKQSDYDLAIAEIGERYGFSKEQ